MRTGRVGGWIGQGQRMAMPLSVLLLSRRRRASASWLQFGENYVDDGLMVRGFCLWKNQVKGV